MRIDDKPGAGRQLYRELAGLKERFGGRLHVKLVTRDDVSLPCNGFGV